MPPFLLALLAFAFPQDEPVAIADVTIVDVRAGELVAGQTVVVRGERIEAAGPSAEVGVPANARRVDGAGGFLIPGLWDMHVHMTAAARFGELYVANGVTGVRDMFTMGNVGFTKGLFRGERVGPRVVAAGRIVDGEDPYWPGSLEAKGAEEGRAAVATLREDGADFVKVYSKLSRESYFAIAAEAKRLGMPFCGHVPDTVRASEASDAGQKSIEHLTGIQAGCSNREDELLRMSRATTKLHDRWILAQESFDEERAQDLFAMLAANRTWQCPTLVVLRSVSHMDDPEFCADERMKYLPAFWASMWKPENDIRFKVYEDEDWVTARKTYARSLELVSAMREAGVPFLAGTDVANPYTFPGFSLHDELELLVSCGFTSAEALRTATWNPAVYFEREDELGSVEPGKLADLVLLEANPLQEIGNTRRIRAVVANGQLFESESLRKLLDGE